MKALLPLSKSGATFADSLRIAAPEGEAFAITAWADTFAQERGGRQITAQDFARGYDAYCKVQFLDPCSVDGCPHAAFVDRAGKGYCLRHGDATRWDWLEDFEWLNPLIRECAELADELDLDEDERRALQRQFPVGEHGVDWLAVKEYLLQRLSENALLASDELGDMQRNKADTGVICPACGLLREAGKTMCTSCGNDEGF